MDSSCIDRPDLSLVEHIESCLEKGYPLELAINDGRSFAMHVHRIVFLDGGLSLVGEDCVEKCIIYVRLSEIISSKLTIDSEYVPNFATVEINDFISAIRTISGTEERLVLKIRAGSEVDINPKYQCFGKPYVTSNMDGDKIWAAYVEVSDVLYEWLISIRPNIEILDPGSVKDGILEYCERRLVEDKRLKNVS